MHRIAAYALAAVMIPAAMAQYASPVKVTNASDSPVPVRSTVQTTSTIITFKKGDTSNARSVGIPTCTGGAEFLINSVTAAPGLFSTMPVGAWGVEVNMKQSSPAGDANYQLLAYATGAQQASVTLPAGQPVFTPGFATIDIALISGPAQTGTFFIVHVSGYCGVAFVSPVAQ